MANRRNPNDNSRRKSDPGQLKLNSNEAVVAAELPWGTLKVVNNMSIDFGSLPAKFNIQHLLFELLTIFERKIHIISTEEPLDKSLNKSLRRCDEPYLDNLLRTLNNVSEICLPSILEAILQWYEQQIKQRNNGENKDITHKALLALNYLFCIVLIEILPQIHFHPGDCDKYVNCIVSIAFSEGTTKFKEANGIHSYNNNIVAETFAEVIGVLSQSHAKKIQQTFFGMLNEVKKETFTSLTLINIIALLKMMKFYRIKTSQISDIEEGVDFLDKVANYYLEIDLKQKELKHAVGGLLVEILLPVAAQIKTEANLPKLIQFVDKLYGPTLELTGKKQHKMAAFPLLTCLLCISQSKFFLSNWGNFLNTTLANLKSRDSKISRVALESLYRLLWVYIIRNNCEGNTATRTKLESICSSIFPKSQRYVIPRDAPLNIFVKIIHFIAQQKLDFAFKEIIFELLGCQRINRSSSITINPERMNIGIRSLMVIADGLQQKEDPPGMPRSLAPIASGTMQRIRKTYLTRPLTADIARSLGLEQYYTPCRKAFDAILRTLDTQVGKSLMRTSQVKGKEPDELLSGDVKPKLDLFRTCIAAIPRLLPEPMLHYDLIDLLIRMTVHMDEELSQTAYLTLQNLITECVDWREDIIHNYVAFLTHHIQDTFPSLLESTVRFLIQLLCCWKSAIIQEKKREQNNIGTTVSGKGTTVINNLNGIIVATTSVTNSKINNHNLENGSNTQHLTPLMNNASAIALHNVEGFALALLCQNKQLEKRTPFVLLREVKTLLTLMDEGLHDKPVLTLLDEATPYVLNKYIEHVSLHERQSWPNDFINACDKINHIETDANLVNSDKGNEYLHWDPWACALSGYCEDKFLPEQCPTAVSFAWPAIYIRLNACNQFIDPSNPQNENRASLLRSSKSKATTSILCGDSLDQSSYLTLWQRYLVVACALTQPPVQSSSILSRSFSPNGNLENLDSVRSMTASLKAPRVPSSYNCTHLFTKISSMLRWEQKRDIRDAVVLGIGSTNPKCFDLLLEDLANRGLIREIQDKKNESNVRRRKRKDALRMQMIRVVEVAMWRNALQTGNLIDPMTGQLNNLLFELINGIKNSIENDYDREPCALSNLRLHFAKTVALLINSVNLDQRKNLFLFEKKKELSHLFSTWCIGTIAQSDRSQRSQNTGIHVEIKALHALCAVLCCGPALDSLKDFVALIMKSTCQTAENIREEWLATVLHLNDQNTHLFDFVIDLCYSYTAGINVTKSVFKSLLILFSKRSYQCDTISLLILCQVYSGDADPSLRQAVGLLIQILRKEFLEENSCANMSSTLKLNTSTVDTSNGSNLDESNMNLYSTKILPFSQEMICKQLAENYPMLTIQMISGLFNRFEKARPDLQVSILKAIEYWLENVELVDPYCEITIKDEATYTHGYGNVEVTHLILNNLTFITTEWLVKHKEVIPKLWINLVKKYPANLPIVIHYLFVIMSLSPEIMIPVSKRIINYLLNACGEKVVVLLNHQLSLLSEQFKYSIIRHNKAPFYKWQQTDQENNVNDEESNDKNEDSQEQISFTVDGPKSLSLSGLFYYNDLQNYLQTNQPIVHFTKSNLALFLLCDLITTDENNTNWSNYATTIFHISLLYLDSSRPMVCKHARKILINLCLYFAPLDTNYSQVATLLLNNGLQMDKNEIIEKYSGTNDDPGIFHNNGSQNTQLNIDNSFSSAIYTEYKQTLFFTKSTFSNQDELLQALIYCLSEKMDKPLWTTEEITPRGWKLDNNDQLNCFIYHLIQYFEKTLPKLAYRWTDFAMGLALTINYRHFASRSLQIAAALCQNPTPWVGKILSRLAEIVGDHNEDTQCYITYIMLCLQSLLPYVKSNNETIKSDIQPPSSPSHSRSISYTPALLSNQNSSTTSDNLDDVKISPINGISRSIHKKDGRHSMLIENEALTSTPLNRSKSATTLKVETLSNEESILAFTQIMSIAVAMLESHIDNEYLLALNLLDKLLDVIGKERDQVLQRLDKMIKQLEWNGFTGVIGLTCRGATYTNGYEVCVSIFIKCISMLNDPIVLSSNGFSLIVISILPYLLNGFDNMNQLCITAAQTISVYCQDQLPETLNDLPELTINDHPLSHLSTMMIQYTDRSFSRDRFQWTKCVVNYLLDAVKPNCVQLVVLLCEMLEKCNQSLHMYLLHIIYLVLSYGDFTSASPVSMNAQIIRIVSRHLQGNNWKEAARIIKTIVDKWNIISSSQINSNEIGLDKRKPSFELYIGNTCCPLTNGSNNTSNAISPSTPRKFAAGMSGNNHNQNNVGQLITGTMSGAGNVDSLKRQNNTVQSKVRDRLIGLLAASGMQVGVPKSASFIFSQSTTDIYHDNAAGLVGNTGTLQGATSNSAYSSSERISHLDDLEAMSGSSMAAAGEPSIATGSFPRVFREFDFLDAEHDSISESTESGFNFFSTIRPPRRIDGGDNEGDIDNDFINPGDGDEDEEDDIDEASDRAELMHNIVLSDDNPSSRLSSNDGLSTLKKRQRRPLSGASESNDVSSDRTPVQSVKHSDESCPSCPNTDDDDDDIEDEDEDDELEELDEFKSQKSHRGPSSIEDIVSTKYQTGEDGMMNALDSASSIQCRSEFSLQNTSVYGGRKAPIYLECNHHSSGNVEQVWMALVNEVPGDQDGEITAHCILMFSQLFRECCVKLSGLLRDASHTMAMTSTVNIISNSSPNLGNTPAGRDISGYFTHATDVLLKVADCPFLFVTAQYLRSTNLLQTQRFALYELKEHYETFMERKEQCIRALNSMKSSYKLMMINGSTNSNSYSNLSNQEVDLSKCMHKLFFQLLQMLYKLHDMIKAIQNSSNAAEYDLSPAVLSLQKELLACIPEMPTSESRVSTTNLSVPSRNEQHFDALILHMTNKLYKNALLSLRQLRSQYGSEFGCCDHMDVDVLLIQFCRSHTLRTWAIVGSIQLLEQNCTQLKEISMQFAALVRTVVSDAHLSIRSSRVSSVNESFFSTPSATNT